MKYVNKNWKYQRNIRYQNDRNDININPGKSFIKPFNFYFNSKNSIFFNKENNYIKNNIINNCNEINNDINKEMMI